MTDFLNCNWDKANYLIFSNNVYDPLIYYSHLLPLASSIILGLFVFFSNRKLLINKLFFILTLLFSVWVYFDMILWATGNMEFEMFFWAIMLPLEFLIFTTSFVLVKKFIGGRDISLFYKILFTLFLTPILLFTHTKYNLTAFDYTNCDRAATEGPLWIYLYIIEGIIFLIILGEIIYALIKDNDKIHRIKSAIFSGGIITFLGLFIIGNVTIVQDMGWGYEQYKLFGMIGFLLVLTFLIVRFKSFDIKLIGSQALVWALVILVGAQFFFIQTNINRVLTAITLIISALVGLIIVRSVKKEIAQKEHIEKIAGELKIANEGQENLIHVMNHQIKGFFGIARNIFAELLTDDYGQMPMEAKPLLEKGLQSTSTGVDYVQDILRGSSAAKGILPYDMKPVDVKAVVSGLLIDQKEIAEKKGLSFVSEVSLGDFNTIGDRTHLREAFKNLITNAIKYNDYNDPNRGIKVFLTEKDNKIVFSVRDTGIGITEEDKPRLFTAGGMGKDSTKYNVESSGFGLAFVKGVAEAHKGNVGFKSNTPEKGTTFFIELPIIKTIPNLKV